MHFKRKPPQLFQLYQPKRFRTTKLDIFVVTIVFIVFIWAFFIGSFNPVKNETGEILEFETQRGYRTFPEINMQFFIAPIILVYEMFVLIVLDGKLKGRDLPWGLYWFTLKTLAENKLKEGIEEYKNWKKGGKK